MAERRQLLTGLRSPGAFGLALAVALTAGACGSDGRTGEPDTWGCADWPACETSVPTTSPATATAIDVQLRPVLSVDPASIEGNSCPTDLPVPVPVPTEIVVSPGCTDGVIDFVYGLGSSALDGSAFESARAVERQGARVVNPVLKPGAAGLDAFNAATAHCYAKDETCSTGQLAIAIDSVVISAPMIQQASFQADQIQIMGAPFSEAQAAALAAGIDAAG